MSESKLPGVTSVRVRELALLADIGINPDEIGRRQPLIITVELLLETQRVRLIGDTIDYRRIAAAAEALAQVHIPLIEIFAHKLGETCVSWGGVVEACVSIDKPFALTKGTAGVEVTVGR